MHRLHKINFEKIRFYFLEEKKDKMKFVRDKQYQSQSGEKLQKKFV